MAFDYEGAKQAGYSDQEIQDYLAKKEASKTQAQNPFTRVADLLGLGTTARNISLATLSPLLGRDVDKANESISTNFQKSRELIKQAQQEKDPEKKKRLLEQSRMVDAGIESQGQKVQRGVDVVRREGGVTDQDLSRKPGQTTSAIANFLGVDPQSLDFATRRGLAQSGELAAYTVPGKIPAVGSGAGGRILTSTIKGATGGAIKEGTSTKNETVTDAFNSLVQGGLVGGAVGGAVQTGIEGGRALVQGAKRVAGAVGRPVGKYLVRSSQKIPAAQARSAFSKGKDPMDFFIENKLTGTPDQNMEKITPAMKKLWGQIDDQVKLTDYKNLNEDIADSLVKNLGSKYDVPESQIDDLLANIDDELRAFRREYGDELTARKVAELNAQANARVFTSTGKASTSTSVDKNTWAVIRDALQGIIDGQDDKTVRKALDEYSDWAMAREITKATGARGLQPSPITNFFQILNSTPFRVLNKPGGVGSRLGQAMFKPDAQIQTQPTSIDPRLTQLMTNFLFSQRGN